MTQIIAALTAAFQPKQQIPPQYRSNFWHLYFDIGWFGLLNGTVLAFISVYAARIGGTSQQVGLIGAIPAVVALLLTLPAGRWLGKRPIARAVFWSAAFMRIFYLLLIPLPSLLPEKAQIWFIISMVFLMNIPGVPLVVGFNSLFAEAVPSEYRAQVAGIRNAAFAVVTLLSTLAAGQILTHLDFKIGYQIIFGIGFLGAAMSTFHLHFIRIGQSEESAGFINDRQIINPPQAAVEAAAIKPAERKKAFEFKKSLRAELLNGPYGKILILLFIFHLFQYLPIPIFPVYQVNTLKFSDQVISIGGAAFYLAMFVGSTQIATISKKLGHHKTTSVGIMFLALYPALMVVSQSPVVFVITSLVGGGAWSLVGTASVNYLLEKCPPDDRPAHLAWYNLALNLAILLGSLGGPAIGGLIGQTPALLIYAAGRFAAGIAIDRWGS